nr:HNH endonuclease signature motif containing protein [uncultured Rhodoferax sp.]
MELLASAGHSVDHWSRNADGSSVATPAANPNYCYDWSFGSASEGVVLCVWHEQIKIDDEVLFFAENMHALDIDLSAIASSSGRSPKDRDRARQQATRARDFDALVRVAFEKLLPVRFILNEGNRASSEELGVASSEVSKRALDTESWYVHEYNERTGDCRIARGFKPARDIVDERNQGLGDDYRGPEDERQFKAISVRRGQRDFRDRLLAAWNRRCVVTESRVEGLLEAAHIIPHSEVTDYRTSNGLLLRADIHTLYDIGLLSIDQHMRVHLASALMMSEYKQYEGKRIERRPEIGADAPSQDALRARHTKFLEGQAE